MKQVDEVYSRDGSICLRICLLDDGTHILQRFEKRFDEEEATSYLLRSKPDPVGRYVDASTALSEARRLCEQNR